LNQEISAVTTVSDSYPAQHSQLPCQLTGHYALQGKNKDTTLSGKPGRGRATVNNVKPVVS